MVVSSPPKCCNQEGTFGDVNVDVLQILKERFSSCTSRPCFFNILLLYCTNEDIPDEAKNFKMFELIKDLDKILWFIHNGGKMIPAVDSVCILLGPKLNGGKYDFKSKGTALLTSIKKAEDDLLRVCKCQNSVEIEDVLLQSHTESNCGECMDSVGDISNPVGDTKAI
jgi:hypothetical protein